MFGSVITKVLLGLTLGLVMALGVAIFQVNSLQSDVAVAEQNQLQLTQANKDEKRALSDYMAITEAAKVISNRRESARATQISGLNAKLQAIAQSKRSEQINENSQAVAVSCIDSDMPADIVELFITENRHRGSDSPGITRREVFKESQGAAVKRDDLASISQIHSKSRIGPERGQFKYRSSSTFLKRAA